MVRKIIPANDQKGSVTTASSERARPREDMPRSAWAAVIPSVVISLRTTRRGYARKRAVVIEGGNVRRSDGSCRPLRRSWCVTMNIVGVLRRCGLFQAGTLALPTTTGCACFRSFGETAADF